MATYKNLTSEDLNVLWPDCNYAGMKNRLTKIKNSPLIGAESHIKHMKKIKGEFVSSSEFEPFAIYETPHGPIMNPGDVLDQFAKIRKEYEKGNVNSSVEAILDLLEDM